jgi:hypothetical protein
MEPWIFFTHLKIVANTVELCVRGSFILPHFIICYDHLVMILSFRFCYERKSTFSFDYLCIKIIFHTVNISENAFPIKYSQQTQHARKKPFTRLTGHVTFSLWFVIQFFSPSHSLYSGLLLIIIIIIIIIVKFSRLMLI